MAHTTHTRPRRRSPRRVEPPRRSRRLLIGGLVTAVLMVGTVTVGVYGLLRGPATPASAGPDGTSSNAATASADPEQGAAPAPIPPSGDPVTFARSVAQALFTWDTATDHTPADYAQPLADVASPAEADAFAADVRAYLPTAQAWAQLRPYQTRQWLTLDTATVPDAWKTALAQAAPGQIPPGTTAVTITGTRHRAGIWGTTPTQASRSVTFTVFVTCTAPVPDRPGVKLCQVLRLSGLDKPLN